MVYYGKTPTGDGPMKETEKENMKKGLIIALCVLLVLLGGLGYGYYRLHGAAQDAQTMQQTLCGQYETMLQNADETTFTVTENGEPVGTYTLSQLGLLDATKQAITAGFTADERMDPAVFAEKSMSEKLEWRSRTHTQPGTVRADMVRYTDEAIVSDLEAVSRVPAQDACMEFDGEKFQVKDEIPGNELQLEPIRAALREAVSKLSVDANGAQHVSFELTGVDGCYLAPEITVENTKFDFNELLQTMLENLTYQIDLNLEGQNESGKIVTLTGKDLKALVSADKDGSVRVDEEKLAARIDSWKALADVSNTSYILNTYVDGPKPMDFLKVDYRLDTEHLTQELEEALQALTPKDIRAQMLLYKNGEPYEPLTDVYVEVDIDNQRLTVYKAGEVVISTDVVTGNLNGFQTITGLYYAYNKEIDQWMKGEDYLVFSKYWIGIEGAYGLHDASWRTHFGKDFYVNGGSHGCVNIPVDAMPTIFETVEVGDAIILFGKNKWFEPDPETTRILQS